MVSIKSVPRKIAKILKNRLENLKMLKKYQELPLANTHQEEVDENALNEALEARLMELIASAPQQNLSQPWIVNFELIEDGKVPANLDNHFANFQTFCQVAQPQQL